MEEKQLIKKEEEIVRIDLAVKLIDPKGDLVKKLREEYDGLIITDPHDKDQIAVFTNAIKAVREERIAVNKRRGDIKKMLNKFKSEIEENGNTVYLGVVKLENELKEKKAAAEQIVKDAKAAEEAKAAAEYSAKVDKLVAAGFTSNQVQMIAGSIVVDHSEIQEMSEEKLEDLCKRGKEELDRIAKILADAAKAQEIIKADEERKRNEEEARKIAEQNETANATKPEGKANEIMPIKEIEEVFNEPIPDNFEELLSEKENPISTDLNLPDPVQVSLEDRIEQIPEGFELGWEAFRRSVLEILEEGPIQRSVLIERIQDLKPN